eukprot:scpid57279/ scgid33510/ 
MISLSIRYDYEDQYMPCSHPRLWASLGRGCYFDFEAQPCKNRCYTSHVIARDIAICTGRPLTSSVLPCAPPHVTDVGGAEYGNPKRPLAPLHALSLSAVDADPRTTPETDC